MVQQINNKIDISKLPIMNIGLVGHIDHGKTTLLQKLTGKWTDSHSEELKRGITIKLGYADAVIFKKDNDFNIKGDGKPECYVTFVDAPGHEMLMATMLSGAAIIDAAILVIAANEGIKPQTREHLMALEAKNVKQIIIVQNKIDLVSKEQAEKNYKEIKEFVKGTIAENSLIIPISAQQGIHIDKVLQALCELKIPKKDEKSEPVFIIARSFDINKPGTPADKIKGAVLGGALKKGQLKIGDEIEIKPGLAIKKQNQEINKTIKTKIVSMQRGKYKVKKAGPGGSLAIETQLDMSLAKADSLSGQVAGLAGKLPEITKNIKLKINLFKEVLGTTEKKKVEQIKLSEMLMLSVNTTITIGTVKKISKDKKQVELTLNIPIVAFKGDCIGIARNINGHWRLIGLGELK